MPQLCTALPDSISQIPLLEHEVIYKVYFLPGGFFCTRWHPKVQTFNLNPDPNLEPATQNSNTSLLCLLDSGSDWLWLPEEAGRNSNFRIHDLGSQCSGLRIKGLGFGVCLYGFEQTEAPKNMGRRRCEFTCAFYVMDSWSSRKIDHHFYWFALDSISNFAFTYLHQQCVFEWSGKQLIYVAPCALWIHEDLLFL